MKQSKTLLSAILLSTALIGCNNKDLSAPETPKVSETTNSMTPVSPIGTVPAGATKDAAATTSGVKSDVSKVDQSESMPLIGQANGHSTILPKTTEFPKTSP